jgi:hypothetical protein
MATPPFRNGAWPGIKPPSPSRAQSSSASTRRAHSENGDLMQLRRALVPGEQLPNPPSLADQLRAMSSETLAGSEFNQSVPIEAPTSSDDTELFVSPSLDDIELVSE